MQNLSKKIITNYQILDAIQFQKMRDMSDIQHISMLHMALISPSEKEKEKLYSSMLGDLSYTLYIIYIILCA